MKHAHQIKSVAPGSIAEELELEPGDKILQINGQDIEDVLDYRFYIQNEEIDMVVQKKDGSEVEWEFDKDFYEDLGIEFESGLMSDYRSCTNKCIFCFIDQMPPGMRDTLYFKDDDARLSFLQGNYITLTNMKEHDLSRIIKYHLSPINISVQTTNPELRVKMLHNRFAGKIMETLNRLRDADIEMNGQIVLCKGVNDGAELERSIRDLAGLYPQMQSMSVVPVERLMTVIQTDTKTALTDNAYFIHHPERIVHTMAKLDTDPYGKPAMVYLHEGKAAGIAGDLRRMLDEDFHYRLAMRLYSGSIRQPACGAWIYGKCRL